MPDNTKDTDEGTNVKVPDSWNSQSVKYIKTTDGTKGTYSGNEGELLTTGASSTTEKYHIFDIAGNLWEWTEEDAHYSTTEQYRVSRGGSYIYDSDEYTACYHACDSASYTSNSIGFRVVLYMK